MLARQRRHPSILLMFVVLWEIGLLLERREAVALISDDQYARNTLQGLLGVQVIIHPLSSDVEQDGLSTQQLQIDVELRLRQVGIRVLTEAERLSAPGAPLLYVQVTAFKHPGLRRAYTYYISVELIQQVYLAHNFSHTNGATWGTGNVGDVGVSNISTLRNTVKDCIDTFINAYLSVNPRPAGSTAPASTSLRRDIIRQVQERLQAAGFNPGAIDGTMGPQTRNALRWFQNTKGLLATGELNEQTLNVLGVR